VDERLAARDAIYGGSTGLGVLKHAGLDADDAGAFSTRPSRGAGTKRAAGIVRRHVPSLTAGATVLDLQGLVAAVRAGDLSVDADPTSTRSPDEGERR
jgi:hypothetical protein